MGNTTTKNSPGNLTNKPSTKEDKTKTSEDETPEETISEVKEEKVDPTQNYKLVGVYFVNKEPRILIKNLSNPELGTLEFREGDYLDAFESILVSKIYYSPTVKVELTDSEGYNYIMKPQTTVDKGGTTSSKGSYSRSAPSYFTGTSSKARPKKPQETSTTGAPDTSQAKKEETAVQQETQPKSTSETPPQQESTTNSQISPSTQAASQAQDKPQSQPQGTPASTVPDTTKGVDTRPKNPFGE